MARRGAVALEYIASSAIAQTTSPYMDIELATSTQQQRACHVTCRRRNNNMSLSATLERSAFVRYNSTNQASSQL